MKVIRVLGCSVAFLTVKSELGERKNAVHLNIWRKNNDRVGMGLRNCVCGKEVVEWEMYSMKI